MSPEPIERTGGHGKPMARYSRVAMLLHWLTAAAFAVQLGLGWRMGAPSGPQTFAVFQLHKSIGITILLLTVIRLGWRLARPAPRFAPTLTPLERRLAHIVHRIFYGLLIALPLTGWLIVSSSARRVATRLFGTLPWPHLPVPAGLREAVNGVAGTGHLWLAWLAVLLIGLHVAGALKHQLLDGDAELGRMVPAPRRLLGGLAVALVALFAGFVILGRTLPLRPIRVGTEPSPAAETRAVQTPASVPTPAPSPSPSAVPVATSSPTPAPSATPTAVAAPSRWQVDKGSTLRFRTSWSQGPVSGSFGRWTAAIVFDPAALASSSVTVTIDMASITMAEPDQQSAVPGDDWFAVQTHPQAVFRATRFRHLGGDRYAANGTLTLRGVSHPQALTFTLRIAGDKATVAGSAVVDRTAFGVGQGEWASTADLPAAVTLAIAIDAHRIMARVP